jgi:hypothetical protein
MGPYRTARPSHPSTLAIACLVLLSTILVACGAGGAGGAAALPSDPRGGADGAAPSSAAGGGEDLGGGSDEGGPGPGGEGPNAAPAEQRIIRTGELTVEVDRLPAALAAVRSLALELGGYVGDSSAGGLADSAMLTLRIPAPRFGDALTRLREMDGAEVVSEATREEDVTGQIVDIEARIRNLAASEASYRVLLERAQRIDDVLAVQARLDEVRGEIEQLEAQLENVTAQADLSTLTVTLIPREEPVETQAATWDPGADLQRAVAALVGIGQALLSALIWFAIVWLPILLVLGILAIIALRGVLEVRRRLPGDTRLG